jgi:peptidoglycan/xylan/chitin deacetylase (PgdA/CDA1 family)
MNKPKRILAKKALMVFVFFMISIFGILWHRDLNQAILNNYFYNPSPTIKPANKPAISIIPSTTPSPTPQITPTPTPTPKPTTSPIPVKITAKEISIGNTFKKQVIFTFDAGSTSDSLDEILRVLEKYNVKGTFFLTGRWVEQNKERTKLIASKGHEIFNHTYNHPDLTKISDEEISQEFKKLDDLVMSLTGKSTKPYFRPPYGARNQHVWDYTYSIGYQSVYWTIDSLDWKEAYGFTPAESKARIMNNLKPGAIVLMHVGSKITGEILDSTFADITAQGYKIVSLTEGL